jgi:ADP-ribose pyrophosphatase YjhB (NUDIX family)
MHSLPHITVATVVEQDHRFLMVKEKSAGEIVYNQPAGHLELQESLIEAAERETLEETAWRVEVSQFLGVYHYTSPANGICYVRHCFIARPIERVEGARLDVDILQAEWLSLAEIEARTAQLRSPMVLKVIKDYLDGNHYPLTLFAFHQ